MNNLIVVWGMLGLLIVAQSLITDWHEPVERWLARACWFFWILSYILILWSPL